MTVPVINPHIIIIILYTIFLFIILLKLVLSAKYNLYYEYRLII